MTDQTDQVSGAVAAADVETSGRPSLLRVVRDQRKAFLLAAILIVATYWVAGPLGEWVVATCVAGGIVLGLANHLATEYWLLKVITSGEEPSRHKMVASTMVRLVILTVVAVSVAAAFWPDGIGLLLGLAVFRLVALVMTGLPLLKELKKP